MGKKKRSKTPSKAAPQNNRKLTTKRKPHRNSLKLFELGDSPSCRLPSDDSLHSFLDVGMESGVEEMPDSARNGKAKTAKKAQKADIKNVAKDKALTSSKGRCANTATSVNQERNIDKTKNDDQTEKKMRLENCIEGLNRTATKSRCYKEFTNALDRFLLDVTNQTPASPLTQQTRHSSRIRKSPPVNPDCIVKTTDPHFARSLNSGLLAQQPSTSEEPPRSSSPAPPPDEPRVVIGRAVPLKPVADNKFVRMSCNLTLPLRNIRTGIIEIQGDKEMVERGSREYNVMYTLHEGEALFVSKMGRKVVKCKGDIVMPKGMEYSIRNCDKRRRLVLDYMQFDG